MDTFFNQIWTWFVQVITTDDAWVYLLCSTIGLYTNIYWTIRKEKRRPKWSDFGELAGQIWLVWTLALYFDKSPLISLVVGIAPDRIMDIASKGVKSQLMKDLVDLLASAAKDTKDEKDNTKNE